MSAPDSYLLIVEDSRVLRDILMDWLKETFPAKRVLGVATMAAAHEAIEALPIDFFLVDYMLPDGSGLDFISDVKTVWPEARFAMMTLAMPEHDRAAMLALKPAAFLRKPIDFAELELVLRNHIGGNSSVATANGGFKATLHGATVLDIIQLNCMEVMTGAMDFRNAAGERGYVYFSRGEIIHAETEAAIGIGALAEIIRWKNGLANQMSSWVPPNATTIGPPWQCALMEAAQLSDEGNPTSHPASS